MPNVSNCVLTIKHDVSRMITSLVNAYMSNELFDTYIPCPPELKAASYEPEDENHRKRMLAKYGYESAFDWRWDNWDNCWEVGAKTWSKLTIVSENELLLDMETKWCAPMKVLDCWRKLGFDIEGRIDNDFDNCTFELYRNGVTRTVIYDQEQYDSIHGKPRSPIGADDDVPFCERLALSQPQSTQPTA